MRNVFYKLISYTLWTVVPFGLERLRWTWACEEQKGRCLVTPFAFDGIVASRDAHSLDWRRSPVADWPEDDG